MPRPPMPKRGKARDVRGPFRVGVGRRTGAGGAYGVTTTLPRISAEWPGKEQKKV